MIKLGLIRQRAEVIRWWSSVGRAECVRFLLAAWLTSFFWLLPFSRLFWVPALLLCFTGLAVLFRAPERFQNNSTWQSYYRTVLLLAGAVAFSAIGSLDPMETLETVALYLLYIPLGAAIFYLVAQYQLQRLMLLILAAVALFWCFDGVVQTIFGQDLFGYPGTKRLGIYFSSPMKFGFYLPYALVFLFFYPFKRRIPWYAFGLLWLLALFVVVEANTRASTLVFMLLSWVYLVNRWGAVMRQNPLKSFVACLALPAVMLSVVLSVATFDEDVRRRVERTVPDELSMEALDVALSRRLDLWGATVRAIHANPVNGFGTADFDAAISGFFAEDSWFQKKKKNKGKHVSHAHQVVLDVLVSTGVIGLFACLVAVWLLVGEVRQGWSADNRALWFPFLLTLGLLWFPFNTHRSFFSSELINFSVNLLALCLAVKAAGVDRSAVTGSN